MNKKEFLDILREQLQGTMSRGEMEGHIRYYDDYISEEIRSGKSQQQIMEELGSPVFIAKTLIDTAQTSARGEDAGYEGENGCEEESQENGRIRMFHLKEGIAGWLIPLILLLVFAAVVFLLGSVAVLAVRYFLPILLVLVVVAIFKSKKG